jgi:hypothetical protein
MHHDAERAGSHAADVGTRDLPVRRDISQFPMKMRSLLSIAIGAQLFPPCGGQATNQLASNLRSTKSASSAKQATARLRCDRHWGRFHAP